MALQDLILTPVTRESHFAKGRLGRSSLRIRVNGALLLVSVEVWEVGGAGMN
jgi:hypothetical protein